MRKKYRKKPVVIEAMQLTWDNWNEMCDFVGVPKNGVGLDYKQVQERYEVNIPKENIAMTIYTLEGNHLAKQGDYIIKGVNGEFYPCKPDIFEKTYEEV